MNKSETIGKLAGALSKFQSEVQDIHKAKSGYGYKYADLSQVLEVARPLLSVNELAVSQLCESHMIENQPYIGVETILMHASGEWISSVYHMGVQVGKGMSLAQASGSVITYARRYALAAILGITQTDNDASLVSEPVVSAEISYSDLATLIKEKKAEERVEGWRNKFSVEKLTSLTAAQRLIIARELQEI